MHLLFSLFALICAPSDEVYNVQVTETVWRFEVEVCGVRVPLVYANDVEQELIQEPGPWVYGVDYPVGTACPIEALAGCYVPPNPEVPPP